MHPPLFPGLRIFSFARSLFRRLALYLYTFQLTHRTQLLLFSSYRPFFITTHRPTTYFEEPYASCAQQERARAPCLLQQQRADVHDEPIRRRGGAQIKASLPCTKIIAMCAVQHTGGRSRWTKPAGGHSSPSRMGAALTFSLRPRRMLTDEEAEGGTFPLAAKKRTARAAASGDCICTKADP
jgi:hypothetical protein